MTRGQAAVVALAALCAGVYVAANRQDAAPRKAWAVRRAGPAGPARSAIEQLRQKALRLPIDGMDVEKLKGSFDEEHSGHKHEAADILAPRGTPIHAVEDGTIAKLFESKAGGHTIYQFDPSQRYCYYYAHLDHYADGLANGQPVTRGQIIGYVGTSGNAPPDTPHLHFTIFELTADTHWWEGRPIDPYLVFRSE